MSSAPRENRSLERLLEQARQHPMDSKERVEQRRSFAYGNAAFENPRITKEIIEDEEKKMSVVNER